MNKHMELWNKVSKTDKAHTKEVKFGRGFTAIDAHYQIRNVTEQFGVVGVGWGWNSTTEYIHLPNKDVVVVSGVSVWTHADEKNIFGPFNGCKLLYNAKKDQLDDDAPKKAITDGLTKAISHLGFNADVFLGKFDGNKYTEEDKKTEKNKKGENNDESWAS
jgi:hypothetical protein|tara:strand:+ start:1132 stop:1614 length:483 start_codon:yes stop_codon:yes gene_type:complete